MSSVVGIPRPSHIQVVKDSGLFRTRPQSVRRRCWALWAAVYSHLIDLVSLSGTELRPAAVNCLVDVCETDAMSVLVTKAARPASTCRTGLVLLVSEKRAEPFCSRKAAVNFLINVSTCFYLFIVSVVCTEDEKKV